MLNETQLTPKQALSEASKLTGSILIENPNRYGKKSFLRRKLYKRHGKPMVRIKDYWHEVIDFKRQEYSGLFIFRTDLNDQYKPSI